VQLKVHREGSRFLEAFIEQALGPDPAGAALAEVQLQELSAVSGGEEPAVAESELNLAWDRALGQIDDDNAQQNFIKLCLSARRLDFALERYRALKAERPDDERVAKYLLQIGTILSFSALQRSPDAAKTPKLSPPVVFMIMLVVAIIALMVVLKAGAPG
jgi:hypothetical protein